MVSTGLGGSSNLEMTDKNFLYVNGGEPELAFRTLKKDILHLKKNYLIYSIIISLKQSTTQCCIMVETSGAARIFQGGDGGWREFGGRFPSRRRQGLGDGRPSAGRFLQFLKKVCLLMHTLAKIFILKQ